MTTKTAKEEKPLQFTPEGMGFICPLCGTANPSIGAVVCGNCGGKLHEKIKSDKRLTLAELLTQKAIKR